MAKIKTLYENPLLVCSIVADSHIDEKHPYPFLPKYRLCCAMKDTAKAKRKTDAFIIVGDITSRGSDANWKLAMECFDKFRKKLHFFLPIGNHDGWNDDGWEAAEKNYLQNVGSLMNREMTKPYFSEIIGGCYFIALGNDADSDCCANIGEEQLGWFREEMKKAQATKKPVFVFCHQPLNDCHGLPVSSDREEKESYPPMEGGVGPASDKIKEILDSVPNVYFFSGHSHMGFAGEKTFVQRHFSSFEQHGDTVHINLPSLACGNHHGEKNPAMATGVMLEVYSDRVVIRLRNFKHRRFITSIKIKDSKPYFEKAY